LTAGEGIRPGGRAPAEDMEGDVALSIIVQKFGGSSLATAEARNQVAQRVAVVVSEGRQPVIVVSAIGRSPEPYATDTLLHLVGGSAFSRPRDLDMLAACGEVVSAVVMAATLRRRGLRAAPLTGWQAGIKTDGKFGDARILEINAIPVKRLIDEGAVPVVAGFQGATAEGDITTLGRGGSDTTAVALGAALSADVVEIYTDVDGVQTADPRLCPEACTLEVVAYDEVAQMAHEGARVLHPRAVELAMRSNIPVRVRSTFSETDGTLVTSSFVAAQSRGGLDEARTVTGVTHIPGMAQVRVACRAGDSETELRVFRSLAEAGVSIDLINVSPESKIFAVLEPVADTAERVLRGLSLEPEVTRGCAKVSVVGAGMRGVPGVMANVIEALHAACVPILQTADSHVTISCLVPEESLSAAVQALHRQFGLHRLSGGGT